MYRATILEFSYSLNRNSTCRMTLSHSLTCKSMAESYAAWPHERQPLHPCFLFHPLWFEPCSRAISATEKLSFLFSLARHWSETCTQADKWNCEPRTGRGSVSSPKLVLILARGGSTLDFTTDVSSTHVAAWKQFLSLHALEKTGARVWGWKQTIIRFLEVFLRRKTWCSVRCCMWHRVTAAPLCQDTTRGSSLTLCLSSSAYQCFLYQQSPWMVNTQIADNGSWLVRTY